MSAHDTVTIVVVAVAVAIKVSIIRMNDPFRVGLLASSPSNEEDERCVNTNTCIVYSQALLYFLIQNPVAKKNTPIFYRDILESKADFGGLRLSFLFG